MLGVVRVQLDLVYGGNDRAVREDELEVGDEEVATLPVVSARVTKGPERARMTHLTPMAFAFPVARIFSISFQESRTVQSGTRATSPLGRRGTVEPSSVGRKACRTAFDDQQLVRGREKRGRGVTRGQCRSRRST